MLWRSLLQAFSELLRSEKKRREKIEKRGLVRQAKTTSSILIHYNIRFLIHGSMCNQTRFSLLREIQTEICGGGDEEMA